MRAVKIEWLKLGGMVVIPKVEVIEAPTKESEELDFFYKQIDCHMIDVVRLDGADLWVDDEGLLKSENIVGEYTTSDGKKLQLAGNIIASRGADNMGKTLWFEDDDVDGIMKVIDLFKSVTLLGAVR